MSVKLPCEIVKDLLPSYIDGLANEVTKEAVHDHLRECADCTETCETMKKEYEKEVLTETEQDTTDEKIMFHKIKKRLNRKVKIAIEIGVVSLVLAIGIFELLFNAVIKEVSREEVTVTAEIYPMEEIASINNKEGKAIGISNDEDKLVMVTLSDEDKSKQSEFVVQLPNFPESSFTVTQDIVDTYDYMTLIKWKSPYFLRAILWEIKEVDGERIMYIEHYKTTILNSRETNSGSYTTSIDFGALDKIVYLEKDGTETLLWENEK